MIPIWVNTIATNSSAGTIPITLNVTTERLKVPMSIASFSIPLGATINLTGAALYKTILAFFVAEIYGLQLTIDQILMVIIISTIMSIAGTRYPRWWYCNRCDFFKSFRFANGFNGAYCWNVQTY